jgi:N-acetylglucosaminyl-diphospho-decaprenol L-rhamnosyltransferase
VTAPVADELTSVIVVAADSGALLQACVDAVLVSVVPVELILVDNASTDGQVEHAASRHAHDPRLRVLRNDANLGFGPACNRGAAQARGDVFVFLNPDCIGDAHTIEDLRAALRTDARIGVLGVSVLAPDGTPARGNRRRDPHLWRMAMSASGLSRFAARWPALAGVEMLRADDTTVAIETVEAISGACMTLPRAAFQRIGGFDEAYFLHAEDLDLCRRARDADFRVAIAPAIRVIHAQGSSSRRRPVFVARHKHRGLWRYFRKFDPAARNPLLRGLAWIGLWSHFALQAPLLMLRGMIARHPPR